MVRFLSEAGPAIWPIILLAFVIIILALINLGFLLWGKKEASMLRHRSIDAILFWGTLAAAVGFLGQWMGLNNLVQAIATEAIVDPRIVVIGFSESLLTPISGLAILSISVLFWFLLRIGLWQSERNA